MGQKRDTMLTWKYFTSIIALVIFLIFWIGLLSFNKIMLTTQVYSMDQGLHHAMSQLEDNKTAPRYEPTSAYSKEGDSNPKTSSSSEVPDDKPTKKLNVLFIVSDDLRPQLNAYRGVDSPNPYSAFRMYTPSLDALAARSLVLTRAYAQFSVCGPSRASFMTGRRPDTTLVWDLMRYWREGGGNFTTIPQFFKDNGYRTAGLGKVFHQGRASNNDDPVSWTEPYTTVRTSGTG